MPRSIEGYYRSLLDAIAGCPIIWASDLAFDKRTLNSGIIRGNLYFVDGSRLSFRELVDLQAINVRLMYSYHYQAADSLLVFRYDDTPHHRSLAGFPHHKHVGAEVRVIPASAPALVDVLAEIEHLRPST
jgi:hypothetical protein